MSEQIVNNATEETPEQGSSFKPDMTFGGKDFPTFTEVFVDLTHFLSRVPIVTRPLLHDKVLKVIQNKFTTLLEKESVIIDEVTNEIIETVSNILAICIEDVMIEMRDGPTASPDNKDEIDTSAEIDKKLSDVYEVLPTAGSALLIQNVKYRHAELKGIFDWMGEAMTTAEEWGAWIKETVASAEEKVAKQKGEIRNADGEVEQLTSSEWREWKENLKIAARGMMERKRGIVEAVVKLGGAKAVTGIVEAVEPSATASTTPEPRA